MDKRFNKVVIWGYPLGSHTHSFIHYCFHKAFSHLGYETYWMTDINYENIDFSKTLFITASDEERKIPLRKDCYYLLHNVDGRKYLENGCKILLLQTHTRNIPSWIKDNKPNTDNKDLFLNDYTYIHKDSLDILFTCWATDLLPHEIILDNAKNVLDRKECVWIGTYGDSTGIFQNGTELGPFFNLCEKNGILVNKINPWSNPVSFEENKNIVNNSFFSPTIQGPWQIENEYIPCRIFKHLSYGHMGYTNSHAVNRIFNGELVYDRDVTNLFYKSLEFKKNPNHIEKLKYLMNEVKEKHTYLNRIKTILEYLPE